MMRNQYNQTAYKFLTDAQNEYQEYLRYKLQVSSYTNKIQYRFNAFEQNPSFGIISEIKMYSEERANAMSLQLSVSDRVIHYLYSAILNSLQALQDSILNKNIINVMLDDSTLNSIASFIQIITSEKYIVMSLRRRCQTGDITSIMTNIDYWRFNGVYSMAGYESFRKFIYEFV